MEPAQKEALVTNVRHIIGEIQEEAAIRRAIRNDHLEERFEDLAGPTLPFVQLQQKPMCGGRNRRPSQPR